MENVYAKGEEERAPASRIQINKILLVDLETADRTWDALLRGSLEFRQRAH
ncbi:hypothetical protein PHLCEN_2v3138 [Hermanssonia centrifuga]|uniref:Uncharacterized protein n=1 Tax=Hermanssonia centrifuga TaxID=98765 RepID=A0A2R6R110_9APHY|nr:hypothetical protein PHLCEN_2v3138 [Hermanssonia centrifuga]